MANRANISFKDSDQDIWEFMEDMHKNGPFRNRSHVVIYALEQLEEQQDEDKPIV